MAVKFFKIPDQTGIFANPSSPTLITSGGIQALKSTVFNIKLGDIEQEESVGVSEYGTPIMDVLEFPEDSYLDLEGNPIVYGGITITAVVLEVSQSKNIVKTPIQGRNGTVNEYVSDGNFTINARGFITNKNNILPLDDAKTFREIMQVSQQIEVVSEYLNEIFDINQIVIESYDMPQIEGFRNQIPFTFQAISDNPINLEEIE